MPDAFDEVFARPTVMPKAIVEPARATLEPDPFADAIAAAVPPAHGMLRLTIPGEPIAKGRGRIIRMGVHMGIKTPDATRRYEDRVRQLAVREWPYRCPLKDVAVTLDVVVNRGIAESWPKKRKAAAIAGDVLPLGRPDADNFAKAILDGCNGVILHDDAMVVDLRVRKRYAEEPRVDLMVMW